MSLIASLSPASTALPTIKPHGRGHKHGGLLDSIDAPADAATNAASDAPSGSVQNLFGSLLQTAEKVVGLQSGAASAAIAAGTAAVSAIAANTAEKSAGTVSTHSASTLLQNYLNNLSPKQQTNGVQAPGAAGTRINADA
jgi:hypothetical protein